MTRYILLIAASAMMYINACAQDMNESLHKTFLAFDTTQDISIKTAQSNKLSLIAKKWKDDWAPHYYIAYAKAQMSFMMAEKEKDKKDAIIDEAEAELAEAVALLGKDNDETFVLKAMIAQARMSVDGRNRWQKYGKIFEASLKSAKELNAENPRIYYLKGTATYFTPKMFGGGAKNALEYFEKAQPLFAKESTTDMNDPFWGKPANEYFLTLCKSGKDMEDMTPPEKK